MVKIFKKEEMREVIHGNRIDEDILLRKCMFESLTNTKGDVKVYAVILMTEPYDMINSSACELAIIAVTVHLSGPFRGLNVHKQCHCHSNESRTPTSLVLLYAYGPLLYDYARYRIARSFAKTLSEAVATLRQTLLAKLARKRKAS